MHSKKSPKAITYISENSDIAKDMEFFREKVMYCDMQAFNNEMKINIEKILRTEKEKSTLLKIGLVAAAKSNNNIIVYFEEQRFEMLLLKWEIKNNCYTEKNAFYAREYYISIPGIKPVLKAKLVALEFNELNIMFEDIHVVLTRNMKHNPSSSEVRKMEKLIQRRNWYWLPNYLKKKVDFLP